MRGAGANFGIATSFTFRLHPFDGTITHGTVVHPVEHARELAAVYRDTLEAGPDELWMSFGLGAADGRPVATVTVHHCGPGEQAEQDLAELRAFGAPLDDSIERTRHLSVQQLHDEEEAWGHRFYMKSVFLPALPDELVDLAVEQISHVPPGADGGFSTWACGGAMASVPDDATAFTGRDASFWLAAEIQWDDPALDDACREWCRAAMSGMAPYESTGRYVNDVSEADERMAAIYGEAKAGRLVALKRVGPGQRVPAQSEHPALGDGSPPPRAGGTQSSSSSPLSSPSHSAIFAHALVKNASGTSAPVQKYSVVPGAPHASSAEARSGP